MTCGVYKSEYGIISIKEEKGFITEVKFVDKLDKTLAGTCLTDKAFYQLEEYFKGQRREFDFPTKLSGTPFQELVWKELMKIPYGQTKSYQEIAQVINNPKASRAIGTAIGKNPILIAIPCHRVIRSDGGIGGYSGGVWVKEKLLALEQED